MSSTHSLKTIRAQSNLTFSSRDADSSRTVTTLTSLQNPAAFICQPHRFLAARLRLSGERNRVGSCHTVWRRDQLTPETHCLPTHERERFLLLWLFGACGRLAVWTCGCYLFFRSVGLSFS